MTASPTPSIVSALQSGRRIVLTTFGSLGDLNPFLALALELQNRGHNAIIATHASHRDTVEAAGVGFHAVRPDTVDFGDENAVMRRAMHLRTGAAYVIREMYLPRLRASYDDLTHAVRGADMLVTHTMAFAGPLVAAKQGIAWASTTLAPISFFSVYDPPVLAPVPGLNRLRALKPGLYGPLFRRFQRSLRHWTDPVRALRRELGLPPCELDPLVAGQFSPQLNLALFSPLLAAPQPDWPVNTLVTGFPFHEGGRPPRPNSGEPEGKNRPAGSPSGSPNLGLGAFSSGSPNLVGCSGSGLGASDLEAFLDSGEPPVVFTLGSSVVKEAGRFYEESADAAQRLGRRAVLLVGRDPRNHPADLPQGVAAFEYAPYSQLFPRAAAIVHQGGIGTTAEALRAGRPMLIVPHFLDQPDNAARAMRLGVARTLPTALYTARRAASALTALLSDPCYAQKAAAMGRQVRAENGTATACDALERLL